MADETHEDDARHPKSGKVRRRGLRSLSVCSPPRCSRRKRPSPSSRIHRPARFSAGSTSFWLSSYFCISWRSRTSVKRQAYFRGHADEISQKIAEGARAREAAEKRRAEAQAKLRNHRRGGRADARGGHAEPRPWRPQRVRALAKTEAEAIERAALAEKSPPQNTPRGWN